MLERLVTHLHDFARETRLSTDEWIETDLTGHCDVQPPGQQGPDGRCVMVSDTQLGFWFEAIKPVPYQIPHDGPVGKLLQFFQRHRYTGRATWY
ncbi:Eukaryotic translation initiation factor 1b [Sporothrix eucalyptigena]|uniref:Eukaryotic translation initiation factor 1b n=1 Tax=Sporothrix eucalyptigena TaxID=1812306 RepID=A0ABP0D0I3_9PEZI